MPRRKPERVTVMISVVAERYGIHPQTLRLYEREGLITPTRSEGNTRLYDEKAIERLETILALTRDLGVNLAGVEIILNMREQLARAHAEMDRLAATLRREALDRKHGVEREHALVRVGRGALAARTRG
jgi:MerR family transcriptional regulator, heat shock protein HspR